MRKWWKEKWNWLKNNTDGLGTVELVMLLVILIALVLMFKDTVIGFISGILQGIESQNGIFNDPTKLT